DVVALVGGAVTRGAVGGDRQVLRARLVADEVVRAVAAVDGVVVGEDDHAVLCPARTGVEGVVPAQPGEVVVAATARDGVGPVVAGQRVVAVAADEVLHSFERV